MNKSAFRTLLFSFIAILSAPLPAQEILETYFDKTPTCASSHLHEMLLAEDPHISQRALHQEKMAYLAASAPAPEMLPNYILPVVVHIIHDNGNENITDAQVLQGIQDLNDAYANVAYYDPGTGVNTNIQFCLAQRTPDGTATTGINRVQSPLTDMTISDDLTVKNLIRWDPLSYINIWLVREICTVGDCSVAGYAYFPAAHGLLHDGIMMEARWFGSTHGNSGVQIHEMGHYLGLYHTFQGACANNDCLTDGDRVCDTPPDQSTVHVPCGSTANSCSTDANSGFTTDENDMYWNYMDYGDWNCYSAFTQGQADRMAFFIDFTRNSLLQSQGCDNPCPVATTMSIAASPAQVDVGSTVTFSVNSPQLTQFEWFVDGITIGMGPSLAYTFNNEGFFNISVQGGNGSPFCQAFDFVNISVVCPAEATFTASSLNIFTNETVVFTSTSSNAASLEWYLDGLLVSTSGSFSQTFPAEGLYGVQLVATNGICSDTTDLQYVIVRHPCDGGGAKQLTSGALSPEEIRKLSDGGLGLLYYVALGNYVMVRLDADQQLVWSKRIGPQNISIYDLAEDPQDGSLLFCASLQEAGGTKGFIFKLDANGNYLWGKKTMQPLMFLDRIHNIPGPAFLLSGSLNDSTRLVKIQPDGTVLWAKRYNGIWGLDSEVLPDGNIYVSGVPIMGFNLSALAKLDPNGNVLWAKRYNSSGLTNGLSGLARPVQPNGSGGVVISFALQDLGLTKLDILASVDGSGDVVWAKKYSYFYQPTANMPSPLAALRRAPDGTYVFYSHASTALNAVLTKVSPTGEFLWAHNFTQAVNFVGRYPRIEILDNGNMAVGHSGRLFITDPNGNLGTCPVNSLPAESTDLALTADPQFFVEIGSFGFTPVTATVSNVLFSLNATCESQNGSLADAEVTGLQAAFCNGSYTLNWQVCNTGTAAIPLGTPYTLYDGNPTTSAAPVILTQNLPSDLLPDSCTILQTVLASLPNSTVYAVFNDDGSLPTPFSLMGDLANAASVVECNFFNNMDSLSLANMPTTTPLPFLGNDTFLCANQTLLLNPGTFASYLWNDGSTAPTLPASMPGTYAVTVTDACGNSSSDAIDIQWFAAPDLDLGPDVTICQNGVVPLDAGSGFASYLWPDGSTEQYFTAWLPGEYIVQVTDACGGVQFDTVVIIFDPDTALDLPTALTTCVGETLTIAVPGFLEYQWLPGGVLDCDNCPTVSFVADTNRVFHLLVKTAIGCYSTDSVAIMLMDTVRTFENLSICVGSTAIIFGQPLGMPGVYEATFSGFNGCDSTHSITLAVLDTFYTAGQTGFCTGDSVLVFGQWVKTPGTYSATFPALNGCDSTHAIEVVELPAPFTIENRSICTGDSTLIFGSWEKMPGTYSASFTAWTGCDSTHSIALQVLNELATIEQINICEGDSTLVFGLWEKTPGVYEQTFTASFGCDSSHTITLTVMDTFLFISEMSICEGDSAFIFGQWEKTPGTYVSQNLSFNGCDSTEVVQLLILPSSETSEQISICAGDSVFVFGQWVDNGGIFTQNYPSANGCDSLRTVTVLVEPDILMQVAPEWTVQKGASVQLVVEILSGQQNLSFNWSPADGLSCTDCPSPFASPSETTVYLLIVTDEQGCTATAQMTVTVTPIESVYLPTAFSPNGDLVNDVLFPQGIAGTATVGRLLIFDRWGEMVFENKDFQLNEAAQGWDGTFRGKAAMAGVYVAVLELEWADGRKEEVRSGLVLVR